jgi:hypothetical protein
MAHRADDLHHGIEEARQDMEDPRSGMTEKLGVLEELGTERAARKEALIE